MKNSRKLLWLALGVAALGVNAQTPAHAWDLEYCDDSGSSCGDGGWGTGNGWIDSSGYDYGAGGGDFFGSNAGGIGQITGGGDWGEPNAPIVTPFVAPPESGSSSGGDNWGDNWGGFSAADSGSSSIGGSSQPPSTNTNSNEGDSGSTYTPIVSMPEPTPEPQTNFAEPTHEFVMPPAPETPTTVVTLPEPPEMDLSSILTPQPAPQAPVVPAAPAPVELAAVFNPPASTFGVPTKDFVAPPAPTVVTPAPEIPEPPAPTEPQAATTQPMTSFFNLFGTPDLPILPIPTTSPVGVGTVSNDVDDNGTIDRSFEVTPTEPAETTARNQPPAPVEVESPPQFPFAPDEPENEPTEPTNPPTVVQPTTLESTVPSSVVEPTTPDVLNLPVTAGKSLNIFPEVTLPASSNLPEPPELTIPTSPDPTSVLAGILGDAFVDQGVKEGSEEDLSHTCSQYAGNGAAVTVGTGLYDCSSGAVISVTMGEPGSTVRTNDDTLPTMPDEMITQAPTLTTPSSSGGIRGFLTTIVNAMTGLGGAVEGSLRTIFNSGDINPISSTVASLQSGLPIYVFHQGNPSGTYPDNTVVSQVPATGDNTKPSPFGDKPAQPVTVTSTPQSGDTEVGSPTASLVDCNTANSGCTTFSTTVTTPPPTPAIAVITQYANTNLQTAVPSPFSGYLCSYFNSCPESTELKLGVFVSPSDIGKAAAATVIARLGFNGNAAWLGAQTLYTEALETIPKLQAMGGQAQSIAYNAYIQALQAAGLNIKGMP